MEKLFIPYEQSLKLKELGFNEECLIYYSSDNKLQIGLLGKWSLEDLNKGTLAPLYQQAFKWFRKKHKLHSEITTIRNNESSFKQRFVVRIVGKHWVYSVLGGDGITKRKLFKVYDEAELECLKKLIKILEEDNAEKKLNK